jgi:hypothetical protein
MNQSQFGNTAATKSIKDLLSKIYDVSPRRDSVYEQAAQYFSSPEANEISELEQREQQLATADKTTAKTTQLLADTRALLKEKRRQQQDYRLDRIRHLKQVARQLLLLIEGDDHGEIRLQAARALGTIQLLSPTKGRNISQINQRHKHAYKAILAVLLLTQLLEDQQLKNRYVLNKLQETEQQKAEQSDLLYSPFFEEIQLPLVMAVLLQDIGLQHPDAQRILRGENGELDEYRTLAANERQELLRISYEQSQEYLKNGLGLDTYIGNSKTERDKFNLIEEDKQLFISHLLKEAIQPEDGIGNLLKIPQVYVSVVLPSKQSYRYDQLPKVSAVLRAGVTKGWYPAAVVERLLQITGDFPQGYGITYIPKDSDHKDLDRYEYAIVNSLYPAETDQPVCRVVTRNLNYTHAGSNLTVRRDNNLYFPQAQKKLERMSEERLREILSKLVSNFEERANMDLIPKCWGPDEFFTLLKNQNLWNRS